MSHHEQQIGEHTARIENIEIAMDRERTELREDLKRIYEKLDEISRWQATNQNISTMNARVTALETSRAQMVGGWKALTLVASFAAACGAGAAWLFEQVSKLRN